MSNPFPKISGDIDLMIEVDLGHNEWDLVQSLDDCLGYTTNELEQVKQANCELVGQLLKTSAFAYLDPSNCTQPGTMYKHPLITKLTILWWFMDSSVHYHKYFDPLPLPLLAFILTMIQCAIDEWAIGEHLGVKFQGAKYADIYQHHLKDMVGWKKFNETTNNNALERLWHDLLDTACLADIVPDLLASTASMPVTLLDFLGFIMDQGGPGAN
ncbi:hypothetical protein EDC04DRAFT_2609882 [Pisolithus marmoratus]|nr:hypothetical protein EDC04DRAFT_2609882 [Pisolithus marmoratus]